MEEFKGKTPCQVRYLQGCKKILDAGWHFSYQGGIDAIINKIESYAHQEYNKEEIKDRNRIESLVDKGMDVFGRCSHYSTIEIDESYPVFLRNNLDKFKHMIKCK